MFDLVSAFLLFRPSYCQSLTFSHVISIFGHWCQHVLFFYFNLHRRNLGGFFRHLKFLYPRCTQTCGFWLTVTSTWWEQRYFGIQKNYIWVVLPNTLFKVPSFHINLGDNLSNLINIDFNKDLFPDVILRTHFLPFLCPSDNLIHGPSPCPKPVWTKQPWPDLLMGGSLDRWIILWSILMIVMSRICNSACYSDPQLNEGGAETSEGDAEENPA